MKLVFVTIPSARKRFGLNGNHASRAASMSPAKRRLFCYNIIGNARTYGRLKDQPCCVCGAERADAHHEDYNDPYTIAFLCRKHHRERHRELGWGIAGRKGTFAEAKRHAAPSRVPA